MNSAINHTFVTVRIPVLVYDALLSLKTDESEEPAETIRQLTEEACKHDTGTAGKREDGLVSVIGKWEGFEEIETVLSDIQAIREDGGTGRDVSFRYGCHHQYSQKTSFSEPCLKTPIL
jgi:hypothetical protein